MLSVKRSKSLLAHAAKEKEGANITDSLFIPGQCSDRQVDFTCARNLCCVHQHRKYCISMYCKADQHEIKHQRDVVNICLEQAELDDELTQDRHLNHMEMWKEFCSNHPDIQYLCVNGLELKQSIQVVEFLLSQYDTSLLCLNLSPFCSARLDLTEFTFSNLMYLTIERIDGESLSDMIPRLPQLRGIYASKSDFDDYEILPDGVQLIVESHCNLEKQFFASEQEGEDGNTCEHMLADAQVIVLNGGPVATDSDLLNKKMQGHSFVIDQDGIKFLGLESYVTYGSIIRQNKYQFSNYLLEMVYDDGLEYLSSLCHSCTILRISNADITTDGLLNLAKLNHLKFIHISLYYGGSEFDLERVHDFIKGYLTCKRFQKFELFGTLTLAQHHQHLFFNLRKKSDVFVYVYMHQTCRWWLMDQVLEQAIRIDGICVYRKASRSLQLDHDFVARLMKQGKTSATKSEAVVRSSETDLQREENYSSESSDVLKKTDENGATASKQDHPSARPASILGQKSGLKKAGRVRFGGVDFDTSYPSAPSASVSPVSRTPSFRKLKLDENYELVDDGEESQEAGPPNAVSDLDHMPEGLGGMLAIEANDDDQGTPGNRVMENYTISGQNESFLDRLISMIRGLRCSCWNRAPDQNKTSRKDSGSQK